MASDRRGEALFSTQVTTGLGAGAGDVIALDTSACVSTTKIGDVYNAAGGANDTQIWGIAITERFEDIYGERLANQIIAIQREGSAHVRITDDNGAIAIGALMAAVADTQTVHKSDNREEANIAVGACYPFTFTGITTGAGVTGEQVANIMAELSATIGTAGEYKAAASGGDQDNRRVEVFLRLFDLYTITCS